jgi:hypothetical protein
MKDRLTQRQLACLRERDPSAADIVDEIFRQADACDERTEILMARLAVMHAEIESLKKKTEDVLDAFVNRDLILHKSMHQSDLNHKNFRRDIFMTAIKTIAVSSIGLTLSFVLYSILESIKIELRK